MISVQMFEQLLKTAETPWSEMLMQEPIFMLFKARQPFERLSKPTSVILKQL
jgi:hypothetical protein